MKRDYYRVYGKIKLTKAFSIIEETNKIMNEFGFNEKLIVESDYVFDVSFTQKLTEDEESKLLTIKTDDFTPTHYEYLGRR